MKPITQAQFNAACAEILGDRLYSDLVTFARMAPPELAKTCAVKCFMNPADTVECHKDTIRYVLENLKAYGETGIQS
jgi:hypothetical protein